jgi:Zn-dependent protease
LLHTIQIVLLYAPVLLFSVIAHEIAHGYAALLQGDRTALEAGRLSWNPAKHIDLYMTILLSLAGVFTNLLVGALCALLIVLCGLAGRQLPEDNVLATTLAILQAMFVIGIGLNAVLIAFNLLPIPPLDGSHVFKYLLPRRLAEAYVRFSRYGILVLVALLFLGERVLQWWLGPAIVANAWTLDLVSGYLLPSAATWLQ